MANNIIKGDELMLFYNGKALAYAQTNTFSLSGSTIDISSKDHGFFGASDVGNITWEITSENFYTDEDFDMLFDIMISKQTIDVVWGKAANYDQNGLGENGVDAWQAPGENYRTGKAIITSLSVNAATGEQSTFSATLTGHGAIKKV
jgi:predicted secreted protein